MGQIRDFFKDQISVYFGSSSQNVLKFDLKIPGYVPFGPNMTLFGPKSNYPDRAVCFKESDVNREWSSVLGKVSDI